MLIVGTDCKSALSDTSKTLARVLFCLMLGLAGEAHKVISIIERINKNAQLL